MSWRDYSSLKIEPDINNEIKKKYSVTGDIHRSSVKPTTQPGSVRD